MDLGTINNQIREYIKQPIFLYLGKNEYKGKLIISNISLNSTEFLQLSSDADTYELPTIMDILKQAECNGLCFIVDNIKNVTVLEYDFRKLKQDKTFYIPQRKRNILLTKQNFNAKAMEVLYMVEYIFLGKFVEDKFELFTVQDSSGRNLVCFTDTEEVEQFVNLVKESKDYKPILIRIPKALKNERLPVMINPLNKLFNFYVNQSILDYFDIHNQKK